MNAFEIITQKLIEKMEAGVIPWESPTLGRAGWPENFATRRRYRGLNALVLGMAEYQSPQFLTFLQAKELGGHVRKGEHGLPVLKVGDARKTDAEGRPNPTEPRRTFFKVYTVFNVAQCDGIEAPAPEPRQPLTEDEATANATKIVANMPNRPLIVHGCYHTPCYVPAADTVHLPAVETFRTMHRYCKTRFHELAHATGHQNRLARPGITEDRSQQRYSLEELTAEMTAAFLCAQAGITDTLDNSAAYLAGWLEVLKGDGRAWLAKAASDAQRAADYILGTAITEGGAQ